MNLNTYRKEIIMSSKENEIMIYKDKNGITKVNVKFIDEDVWLTKYHIADIYKTTKQNIEQHINNIYVIKNQVLIQLARNSCKFNKKEVGI